MKVYVLLYEPWADGPVVLGVYADRILAESARNVHAGTTPAEEPEYLAWSYRIEEYEVTQ